ncbi:cation:proton antiporter [Salininema proteolyticum]|uniref:Cation:proton antiporter n=1 Tax=Salininema proteolyticum TaxID=1607685 RepID=A0ABV8U175_9ACTN
MSHLVQLLLELGGIILALGVIGAVAGRIGISAIPLYLLAGLAFGDGGVYSLSASRDFITTGAEIGVILLLFVLGLEYSPKELIGTMRTGWRSALFDLVANASPGVVVAFLLGWGPLGAMVLGGVTYVSSSGIIAKMLTDLNWLGNRETPTVLGILVAEDLLMALYLPILTTALAGLAFSQAAWGLGFAALAIAGAFFVASRCGEFLSRALSSPSDEVLLLKLLGTILVVAGLAEQIHVSTAVGAFFVGMALSGEVSQTAEKVIEPLKYLFGAVFFVNFGLQTNPENLPPFLPVALALAVVSMATKFGTGWWAAREAGGQFSAKLRAGLILLPRGEFSIVIAGLAVSAGLQDGLASLAACYVLIMAATGPLLVRAADPIIKRRVRKLKAARLAARRTAAAAD